MKLGLAYLLFYVIVLWAEAAKDDCNCFKKCGLTREQGWCRGYQGCPEGCTSCDGSQLFVDTDPKYYFRAKSDDKCTKDPATRTRCAGGSLSYFNETYCGCVRWLSPYSFHGIMSSADAFDACLAEWLGGYIVQDDGEMNAVQTLFGPGDYWVSGISCNGVQCRYYSEDVFDPATDLFWFGTSCVDPTSPDPTLTSYCFFVTLYANKTSSFGQAPCDMQKKVVCVDASWGSY